MKERGEAAGYTITLVPVYASVGVGVNKVRNSLKFHFSFALNFTKISFLKVRRPPPPSRG